MAGLLHSFFYEQKQQRDFEKNKSWSKRDMRMTHLSILKGSKKNEVASLTHRIQRQ
jgi:hypothetical protein